MPRIKYKEAAGVIVKKGKPSIGKKPSNAEIKKLYIKESLSIREVAELLNCSKDMIYRALKEYRIKRRSNIKRSRLRAYKLDYLKKEINDKGFREVGTKLGVGVTTLREYIKENQ